MTIRPATTYYYRVKAVSASGESDYSNVISVTTNSSNDFAVDKQSPSQPSLHKVVFSKNSALIYLLKPPVNEYIEEYKVTVSAVSDLSSPLYSELTYLVDLNTSKSINEEDFLYLINIGNLNPNTLYYFRVSAVNSLAVSSPLLFNGTTTNALTNPKVLGASAIGTSQARVQWTAVDNATGYRLDVSTSSNFSSNIVDNLNVGNVVFRDVTGLSPSTKYFIRVRAYDGTNTSKNSDIVSFTTRSSGSFSGLGRDISDFSILNIFNIDNASFSFNWSSAPEADSYFLDISTSSNFSNFVVENFNTKNTSYTASSLNANTLYYIRIKAVNSFTETAYVSATVSTLNINASLNPPLAVNSGNIKSSSFEAQWVKRTYANRYRLQLATEANFSTLVLNVIVGDVDSYIFDNLIPDTTYYWRVFGLNALNISNSSNVIEIDTLDALPAITNLAASYLNKLNISWTGNVAYTKYYLTVFKQDNSGFLADGLFKFFDVGNSSSFSIDSFLEEDTLYSVYITGETAAGDRKESEVIAAYVPAASPRLSVSNDSSHLSWSKKLNRLDAAYDKDFKFRLPGWSDREVNSLNSSLNIEYLASLNRNIYFRGYYFDNNTRGNYSNTAELFNSEIKFRPLTVTSTSAIVSWYPGFSQYRYRLYIKVAGAWELVAGYAQPKTTTSSRVTLENLTPNTEYKLEVQYFSQGRYSSNNLPLIFKTNRVLNADGLSTNNSLVDPTASITDISFDQFKLNLPTNYSYYLIEVYDRSDFIYIYKYLEASSSIYIPVKSDTEYFVRVYGVQGSEKSPPQSLSFKSEEIVHVPSIITTAPILSNLVKINSQEASVQWTVPANSEDFKIEISQSSNFTYLEKDIVVTRVGFNRAILTGFYSSNIYYVRIYGFNGDSISPYSNVLLVDLS